MQNECAAPLLDPSWLGNPQSSQDRWVREAHLFTGQMSRKAGFLSPFSEREQLSRLSSCAVRIHTLTHDHIHFCRIQHQTLK